jgi:predicted nucleic acid-binding protein
MTYLLDTNTCIRYLNGRAPNVLQRLQVLPPAEVRVCARRLGMVVAVVGELIRKVLINTGGDPLQVARIFSVATCPRLCGLGS